MHNREYWKTLNNMIRPRIEKFSPDSQARFQLNSQVRHLFQDGFTSFIAGNLKTSRRCFREALNIIQFNELFLSAQELFYMYLSQWIMEAKHLPGFMEKVIAANEKELLDSLFFWGINDLTTKISQVTLKGSP
ncbi:MAG: hypothetical protein ACLFQV_04575 [Vulcanimicrobiota bacterium]